MKTQTTTIKVKVKGGKPIIAEIIARWASNYVQSMSKAIHPEGTEDVKSKNDRHRIYYK